MKIFDKKSLSNDDLKIISAAYDKLKSIKYQKTEPIAVIGMSCRFPGANNLDEFWRVIQSNLDVISTTPEERYDIQSYYNTHQDSKKNKISSPYGGYIKGVYDFDASFFDISPKESTALDPQQRVLLEVSVEALEYANQPIKLLHQMNCSVYIGISSFDYGVRLQSSKENINQYLGTGTLLSPAAGRISYSLNLTGPSMVVDTACSSSLVAIHQAVNSLRLRESNISLVGGVGLLLEPSLNICFSEAQMLSPDGKCKTFDASANGYVRGEGCAAIVLKRVSDAIANKDNILGIICGSAVNQDGASGGLTIPSGPSQEEVIKKALHNASTKAEEIDYIETHGTGTPLGDPIEVNAIGSVFSNREHDLKIGSVKTNIGHLEAASGLASLIKVLLSIKHELIPASLHFNTPNPNIPWQELPIKVVNQNIKWTRNKNRRRIAGISSFGFSGTNAHVVIAEPPVIDQQQQSLNNLDNVFVISAKNKLSLTNYTKKLRDFLQTYNNIDLPLKDICFSSCIGRTHYKERIALIAHDTLDLRHRINKLITTQSSLNIFQSQEYVREKIIFLFQDTVNYKQIYQHFQHYTYFQTILNKCKNFIVTSNSWIRNKDWDLFLKNKTNLHINDSCLLSFCMQYSLARFLIHIGIKPNAVTGYKKGEYLAACIAGLFSFESSVLLLYNEITLGVGNDALNKFDNLLQQIKIQKNFRIEFIKNSYSTHKVQEIKYWYDSFKQRLQQNLTNTNNNYFKSVIESITTSKTVYTCHLIIGEGRFLNKEILRDKLYSPIITQDFIHLPSILKVDVTKLQPREKNLLPHIIAYLYSRGTHLIWEHYYDSNNHKKVPLPTYAWNKKHYMFSKKQDDKPNTRYLITQDVTSLTDRNITFNSYINLDRLQYIRDHKIFDKIIFPESTFIEMFLEACDIIYSSASAIESITPTIQNLHLKQPYIFNGETLVRMQVILIKLTESSYNAQIISLNDSSTQHAEATIQFHKKTPVISKKSFSVILDNFNHKTQSLNIEEHYSKFMTTGVKYGPYFQSIKNASLLESKNQILGLIKPTNLKIKEDFCINPLAIDGCLQLIAALITHTSGTYFIMSIQSISYYNTKVNELWCYITKPDDSKSDRFPVFDLTLFNEKGQLIATIDKLQIQYAEKETLLRNKAHNWFYNITWQESTTAKNQNSHYKSKIIEDNETWLIISEGNDITNKLKQSLQKTNRYCVVIQHQVTSMNNAEYIESIKKLTHLVQETMQKHQNTRGIIFTLGSSAPLDNNIMQLSSNLCSTLLHLVQILDKSALTTKPRLCIITKNTYTAQSILQKHHKHLAIRPQQSVLWGMGRVISLENAELKPLFINYNDNITSKTVDNILSDMLFEHSENQILYEHNQRYIARLQYNKAIPQHSVAIDLKGSYLITGGTGALGIKIAKFLAAQGVKHLILLSRTGTLPKEIINTISKLNGGKTTITVLKVDISSVNINDLQQKILSTNTTLKGIIHTAGVLEDRAISKQTKDSFDKVLYPKIQGTWNLHKLTQSHPVDFFICFSSMTSIIGALTQSNYAAANCFMDVFCQYRTSQHLPATSISWGPWAEIGMGADQTLIQRWLNMGIKPINTEDGIQILHRLLKANISHLGVMPTNWNKYPDQSNFLKYLKNITSQEKISILDNLQKLSLKNKKKALTKYIESQICEILEYPQNTSFEDTQGFFELGMNSLTSVEFKNKLQKHLNCTLSSTITFDYPTIEKLVNHLNEEVLSKKDDQGHVAKKSTEETSDEVDAVQKLSEQLGI